jgi:3-methylcrotonyl-CoA carboxylase alpha subunit
VPPPGRAATVAALLVAAGLWDAAPPLAGVTLWAPLVRPLELTHGEETLAAQIAVEGPDRVRVTFAGGDSLAERRGGGWWVDGAKAPARVALLPGQIVVFDGLAHVFGLPDPLARAGAAGPGADVALSPMPGLVKAVFVAAGQAVARGDRLAVLEAMKMEHTLTAARDGVVAEVLAAPGAQVEAGAALVRLEAAE